MAARPGDGRRGATGQRETRHARRRGLTAAGGGVGDDVGDDAETGGRLGRLRGGQQRLVPRSRRRREVGARAGDGAETAAGRGDVAVGGQRWLDPSARRQRLWRRGGHDDDGAAAARTLSRLVPPWLDPAIHDRISPRWAPAGVVRWHLIGDEPPAEQGASLASGGLVAQGRQCMDVELAGRRLVLA
ncbi:hypothetical protein OsJ_00764 [Oryza sativa Japonica Group]|uniref:Uncharacterized protein n=1 Tax=Oryza sativa subsp. japonica TaxID=39947 RepID=A2ZQC6_ORYSJ|nr:hypothetical protein OsJ_00764 [Oryza sativa Japonica Group]